MNTHLGTRQGSCLSDTKLRKMGDNYHLKPSEQHRWLGWAPGPQLIPQALVLSLKCHKMPHKEFVQLKGSTGQGGQQLLAGHWGTNSTILLRDMTALQALTRSCPHEFACFVQPQCLS